MPRRGRIDAPDALHHIICRGIERRRIFWEDSDREDFIQRLETILGATQTACYAWALLPNHFHLLLRTGNRPIAGVMRQLLSGYAGRFNRLHRRSGHLFQNRYKSILCQEEPYLLELVRYIQSVLSAQEERLEARYLLQSQGYDFGYALRRVAQLSGIEAEQILKAGKQPARLYARSLLCHWAVHRLGITAVAVSKLLGISQPAVTRAAYRGESIAAAGQLGLVEKANA